MKLDDLAQRAVDDARQSTAGATPPGPGAVYATARRRRRTAIGGVMTGAAAGIALFAAVSGILGDSELSPRISDPADTLPSTTGTSTTTTAVPPVTDAVPVIPGLDTATADSLPALPHPGVTLLTEETMTPEVEAEILEAVAGLDHPEDPSTVFAAFTKDGVIHATVEYQSGETGLLTIENGTATRFRLESGSWVDVHGIRKQGVGQSFPYVQITWVGVPEGTSSARLTTVQRPDNIVDQLVLGNAIFFEISKPDWTQYGMVTLLDMEGNTIATEEFRLDGASCSAWLAGPVNARLPETDLTTGRLALADALYGCRSAEVARLAVGEGPYFDMPEEDLAASLRDADRRTGLFSTMLFALQIREEEVEGPDGTIYIFDWVDGPRKQRVELGFSADGVWQYGFLIDV